MSNDNLKKRLKITLAAERTAVDNLLKTLTKRFFDAISAIQKRKGKIVITGIGKSGYMGMKTAATLTSLGHHAVFLHPVEALHGDVGMVADGDVLLVISFSGKSPEIVTIAEYLKKHFKITLIAITGNPKSDLARLSDHVLDIYVETEGSPLGLAPMASTTATLVMGDLIAVALTSPANFTKHHFARFHPGGNLGLELTTVSAVMAKGKELPLVSASTLLTKAIAESSAKKFGVVGIVDAQKKLVGVVTDGDIRRFLLKHPNITRSLAKDAMTVAPKVVDENTSLAEALTLMETYKITNVFVVKDGRPVGIVHMHDIASRNIRS